MAEITPSRILTELDGVLSILTGGSGAPPLRTQEDYNEVATGATTMNRNQVSSFTVATSNQAFRLSYFTPSRSFTSSQAVMYSGSTAAGATPTLVRWGLYSIEPVTGDGALIASTASDTTLFAAANTQYVRSWVTPVDLAEGSRYAFACLVVTGATPPTTIGTALAVSGATPWDRAPRVTGAMTGQANLPASFLGSAINSNNVRQYAGISV
jgi:hypothetical protein